MHRFVGTWEPGEFPAWVSLAFKLTLLVLMAVRGMDYCTGDTDKVAASLTEVERAAPLWVWGGALVFFSLIALVGMLFRQIKLILVGHLAGWAIYWAFSVGTVMSLVGNSRDLSLSEVLFAVILILVAVVGGILLRTSTGKQYDFYILLAIGVALASGVLAYSIDGIRSAAGMFGVGALHMWLMIGIAAHIRQRELLGGEEAHHV